jgi:acetolactate synthase-1/2/3 large subunit
LLKIIKNNPPIIEKYEWLNKCIGWKHKYPSVSEEQKAQTNPISIYNLFDKLSDALNEKATVIADAGSTYYTISQAFRVKQGQKILVTSALGSMGFSLPMAIGAHYADTDNMIVAVTGDGSLQMNIQELQTIVHNKIPIKLFVINNGEYASIRNTQNLYFNGRKCGADKESGVSCPDLKKIAEAYGIYYISIRSIDDLKINLNKILSYNDPVICEVFTDPAQQTFPNVGSQVLPDGSMISSPLEDMSPLLSREEFYNEMIIKPIS